MNDDDDDEDEGEDGEDEDEDEDAGEHEKLAKMHGVPRKKGCARALVAAGVLVLYCSSQRRVPTATSLNIRSHHSQCLPCFSIWYARDAIR